MDETSEQSLIEKTPEGAEAGFSGNRKITHWPRKVELIAQLLSVRKRKFSCSQTPRQRSAVSRAAGDFPLLYIARLNDQDAPLMRTSLLFCSLLFAASLAAAGETDQPETIWRFDLTGLYHCNLSDPVQAREAWDTMHLVASLQGNVNREDPILLIRFMKETDDFWFEWMRAPGNWLSGRPVHEIATLEELISVFENRIRGLVIYREDVPANSNVASTIAGVEERICLRYDPSPGSVYSRVMAMDIEWGDVRWLPAKEDGRGPPAVLGELIPGTEPPIASTGSAKGDAYLWAIQRYLDAGRTSDEFLAYYIDAWWLQHPRRASLENFTLSNHDFFIAERAFFFDLGVWGDEAPVDDPGQPVGTDRRVVTKILESMARRADGNMIHIGGFTPWLWKYTTAAPGQSRHEPVETEWAKNKLASKYNAVIDSDALGLSGMANASFYRHFPLREKYVQPRRPSGDDLRKEGFLKSDGTVAPYVYVMFYHGDYDSAAWMNRYVPVWWNDSARGEIPLNWAFNPNLDRRAPHAMHFARTRQVANEWFIAGDSGAGYLNPGMLAAEHRGPGFSDGWEAWVAYCESYYEKYDLTITGFVIDGASPGMGLRGMDAYAGFSPDGLIGQKIPSQGLHRDTMPFIRMGADFHGASPEQAADRIAREAANRTAPAFLPLRTILKSPSWHKETMERVGRLPGGKDVRFVDAYRFMLLLKHRERQRVREPAASGPFGDAKEIVYRAAGESDGLDPVRAADGPYSLGSDAGGEAVIRQERPDGSRYLYFKTGDGFARPASSADGVTLVATVTLLDTAGGRVGLEYNAVYQSYRSAGVEVALEGSGKWRQIEFELEDARFDHSQNAGASFRLVNFGADLVVSAVTVRRGE